MRPQSLQTFADEIRGIPDSLAQAGAVTTFGDLPLIVLSRGLDPDAEWQAGQAQLSQLSSNSQHLIAEKSDHGIQLHQPEAAVAAICEDDRAASKVSAEPDDISCSNHRHRPWAVSSSRIRLRRSTLQRARVCPAVKRPRATAASAFR